MTDFGKTYQRIGDEEAVVMVVGRAERSQYWFVAPIRFSWEWGNGATDIDPTLLVVMSDKELREQWRPCPA